ncbi:MAG TPA: hypothetical protein VGG34_00105 [Opitutaceae bacterium]
MAGVAALVLGAAFLGWAWRERLARVEFVSSVAREGSSARADSPTGYEGVKRWLIVPEHNNPTYQWIEETQGMVAAGGWRVRSVSYENAPDGREVHSASLYRWWLVLVAAVDRAAHAMPAGLSIERAALFADPALQLLFLVSAAGFVAWRFGALTSAAVSVGIVGLFPLCAAFVPGVANDFGLTQVVDFWSVLLVLSGIGPGRSAGRWFAAAGAAGGVGLWLDAPNEIPMALGIALGGILAAAVSGRTEAPPPPWRAWGFAGAVVSLAGYLVEYFPHDMGTELKSNYPLYGLAWLGLGELVHRLVILIQARRRPRWCKESGAIAAALLAVASLPAATRAAGNQALLAIDLLATKLTNLPDGTAAASLADWLRRDGPAPASLAALLPLLFAAAACWAIATLRTPPPERARLAAALGPVLVLAPVGFERLRALNTADAAVLCLLACLVSALRGPGPRALAWATGAIAAASAALGLFVAAPRHEAFGNEFKFTHAEVEGLYERALSQWLADHSDSPGAVAYVPPYRTPSFCFYGGLRGLGTPNWENRNGLSVSFRIAVSTRPDETLALLTQRSVSYIVLLSWDHDLDDYVKLAMTKPTDSFIYALHETDGGVFPWLRPLPYSFPSLPGFEGESALVLQVTDEADAATVRSRLVEYLIEMHQVDQAAFSSQALKRYPANLGALVALAQVEKARGDDEEFSKVFRSLLSNLASGTDRYLPWDRRVSLAVVLALGGREDLSEAQIRRCLSDIDASRIRFLTTGSLYHLEVLAGHYGLGIADPSLRNLALKLLPDELRSRL